MKDKEVPSFECGEFTRYNNGDGSCSCYRNLKFIGAFENTSAFTDLFSRLTEEITNANQSLVAANKQIQALQKENEELREEISKYSSFSFEVACLPVHYPDYKELGKKLIELMCDDQHKATIDRLLGGGK